MLKALEGQQYGFESSRSFRSCIANHRISNLHLSSRSIVEPYHNHGINALDIDKIEDRYLLSGARDGAICVHDLQNSTGKVSYIAKPVAGISRARVRHRNSISAVQWYPFDNGMFTTSSTDFKLKVWDTNTLTTVDKFNLQRRINHHHMSPVATHHSLIAVATDLPNAVLLDPRTGSCCHELKHGQNPLYCVKWSPVSEYLLATSGLDQTIRLWDIRSAKGCLSYLDQHNGEARGNRKDFVTSHDGNVNSLCFTDDGLHLVSFGTDGRVRLWDIALSLNTLVNYGYIRNHFRKQQCTLEICCNTNPPVIFVPSSHFILVLDLFSGCKILKLVAHFRSVNCCAYLSSTNRLYSAGNDQNILHWSPDLDDETEIDSNTVKHRKRKGVFREINADEDNWSDSSIDVEN